MTLDLAEFKELILRTCGFCFESERTVTLEAALRQKMQSLKIDSADTYLLLLKRDKHELDRLVELLTVNETYFFRETAHLNLLIDRLLPEVMQSAKGTRVRILSAGCSTGAEPYSVAIMLREKYGNGCEQMFSVVGVDIDATAITLAREGVFRKGSFRGMDEGIRQRYFEQYGNSTSRLKTEVKAQVEFAVVNLLGPSYPDCMLRPDIILYRNVSIYFPQAVQEEIFRRLAGILNEGGYLLVGATETMHHDIGVLSLVELESLFVYQKIPGISFEERRKQRLASETLPGGQPAHPATKIFEGTTAKQGHVDQSRRTKPAPFPQAISPEALPTPIRETVKHQLFDEALDQARSNHYEQALATLATLIAEQKTFVKAYSLQGSIFVNLGRFEEAHSACERALALDSLCIEAHLMLGIIARHQGDNEQALRRFRQSIYLSPSCWLAHFYLAEIVFAGGDTKRSQGGYETTARILENGSPREHSQDFFPLSFNTEQFLAICRHKLSLLKGNG